MTFQQRKAVEELFDELCFIDPSEWDQRLSTAEDSVVRAEVMSLLAHMSPDSTDLESAVEDAMQAATASGEIEEGTIGPGTRVERYRILQKLGQGGMGTVFSAERDDMSFDKQVALKILHLGMDSPASVERFRQERQILASLEHPYIAHLIDGGETPDGLPYIVLEYVKGIPITTHCEQHSLTRNERLALFLKVCEAVDYAHRNLIVHRDLKPANILVTENGTPKLLDFGIAKLIDPSAQRTMTGFQALTPDYASPEQVRGEIITTASDVYSLGVVLYELLTGKRPYTVSTLSPLEIDRVVCQTPPPRANISDDLDNILQMALRKEPARRYGSAQQLADDIERALTYRPVLARPDTIRYRTKKFVRRNWTTLAAVSLTLTALIAGSGVALYQGRLAEQRFDQVRKLAHNYLFDLHDEIAKIEGSTHAREIMVRTALEYLDSLSKTAGNDPDLKRELAFAYKKVGDAEGNPTRPSLGRTADALASYAKAGEFFHSIAGLGPSYQKDLGDFYADYGALLRLSHSPGKARAMAESSVQTIELIRKTQPRSPDVDQAAVRSWCLLGDIDDDRQEYALSHDEYTRCTAIARQLMAEKRDRRSLIAAQSASERMGTSNEAIGLLKEAAQTFDDDEVLVGELIKMEPLNPVFQHLEALLNQFRSTLYYDDTLPNYGDPSRSLIYSRRYLDSARATHQKDLHSVPARVSYAIALFRLSFSLRESDPEGALRAARESVAIFDELLALRKDNYIIISRRARALRRLGEALLQAKHIPEAQKVSEAALAVQSSLAQKAAPTSEEYTFEALARISAAKAIEAAGDFERAETLLHTVQTDAGTLVQANQQLLTSKILLSHAETALGSFYMRRKHWAAARDCYRQLQEVWRKAPQGNEYVALRLAEASRLLASLNERGG